MNTLENYNPALNAIDASSQKRKLTEVAETVEDPELTPAEREQVANGEIPESKRRAQNRAAQRAFRERKERHLKELENRLAELESESRSWKTTNMALRSQLSLLEEELQQYRQPRGNFNQGYVPMPPNPAPQPNPAYQPSLEPTSNLPQQPPRQLNQERGGIPFDVPHSSTAPTTSLPLTQQSQHMNPIAENPLGMPPISNHSSVSGSSIDGITGGNNTQNSIMNADPLLQDFGVPPYGNSSIPGLTPEPNVPQQKSGINPIDGSNRSTLGGAQTNSIPNRIPNGMIDNTNNQFLNNLESSKPPVNNGTIQPFAEDIIPPTYKMSSSETSTPGLSYDSPNSRNSSEPSNADEFCEKLSTACGTKDKPMPANAPVISSETSAWQHDTIFDKSAPGWLEGGEVNWDAFLKKDGSKSSNNSRRQSLKDTKAADPINLDFGNIAAGFGNFQLDSGTFSDFTGLLNNDNSIFDPMDDIFTWNTETQGEAQQPSATPNYAPPLSGSSDVNSPQSVTDGATDILKTEQKPPSTAGIPNNLPNTSSQNTKEPDFIGKEINMSTDVAIPAGSSKFLPCSDVWDRICLHPRFGEIDINSMCQELRDKAKCSKTGVVLDSKDVDEMLGSLPTINENI